MSLYKKKELLGLKQMDNNYMKPIKTITQRNLCSHIPKETEKDRLRKSWNQRRLCKEVERNVSFVRTQESIQKNSDCPLTKKFDFVQMNCKADIRLEMCR